MNAPTAPRHYSKTLAAFLAAVFGGLGLHRFYLHGRKDFWAWAHFAALPLSMLLVVARPEQPDLFKVFPYVISALIGILAALVIGLTPDDKWDLHHNPTSGRQTASGWPLAVLLVLAFGMGAVGLMAALARGLDLWLTGGAFG
jgi:hypothetical protein